MMLLLRTLVLPLLLRIASNKHGVTIVASSSIYTPSYHQGEHHDQRNQRSNSNEDDNENLRRNHRRRLVTPPKIPQVGTRRTLLFILS